MIRCLRRYRAEYIAEGGASQERMDMGAGGAGGDAVSGRGRVPGLPAPRLTRLSEAGAPRVACTQVRTLFTC